MYSIPEIFYWGVLDGLNPCSLAVFAWFLAHTLSLGDRPRSRALFVKTFVSVYYSLSTAFFIGFGTMFFLHSWYLTFVKSVFVGLGVWLVAIALDLLKKWWDLTKSKGAAQHGDLFKVATFLPTSWRVPAGVLLSVVLALASFVWPANRYMTIIANEIGLPGRVLQSILLIFIYSFFKILPMVLVMVALFLDSKKKESGRSSSLRPSTAYVVLSAFCLAVGVGIIITSIYKL